MPHSISLITTLAAGFGLALLLGFIAVRLRLPALVGYLLAGVAIGPVTPGFVADAEIASQLSEIGVMLLMFGVGLHFSVADLLNVRKIALPGAVVQMVVATAMGAGHGAVVGLVPGQRPGARAVPVGGQHRGAAQGPGEPGHPRLGQRADRRGVAGGRGPGDGPGAGAPAGAGAGIGRHSAARTGAGAWR